MLAETGQEVPGWLGNIAQRHAPYGQKSRRGGGRFGGRDFRKDFGGHNNCEYLGRCVRLVPALGWCAVTISHWGGARHVVHEMSAPLSSVESGGCQYDDRGSSK